MLAQGESKATSLADLALAGTLTAAGTLTTPVGLLPERAVEHRAASAIREALADPDPPAKLTVNIRDAVLETAQRSYGTAMRRQGVERWTRRLNSGACPLCQDLAGDVLPVEADERLPVDLAGVIPGVQRLHPLVGGVGQRRHRLGVAHGTRAVRSVPAVSSASMRRAARISTISASVYPRRLRA